VKSKWTYKKSKQKLGISNFGGLSAVKNVWDTLEIDHHMQELGFTKEGISVNTLAFTYTCKPFTGSASNIQLANNVPDAVFSTVSGLTSINDSTISRFINDGRFHWLDLQEALIKDLINSYTPAQIAKSIVIVDDTIMQKFGITMEGVTKLYDHSKDTYGISYNIVAVIWHIEKNVYPLLFEFQLKENDGKWTKNDIAAAMLKKVIRMGIRPRAVVMDGAYFNRKIISVLDELKVPWVAKCRLDRRMSCDGYDSWAANIAWSIPETEFKPHVNHHKMRYASRNVTIKDHGEMLLVTFIRKGERILLVGSSQSMTADSVITIYKQRWLIETFFRDNKQNIGWSEYHGKKFIGVNNHIFFNFLAYFIIANFRRISESLSKLTVGQILKDVIKSKCQMSGKKRISYIFDFDFKFLDALNEVSRYTHFGIYGN
jgi:hypothetical protein